jgi:Flp pilus assembly protein TadG
MRARPLPARLRSDDGMVTAETAVVLPVLLLVLAGAVAAVTIVGAQLRCVDAAREGARAAARGEDVPAVTALVTRAAPDGATAAVDAGREQVRVTVLADVAVLGPLPLRVRVSADAVAMREPGVAEAAG